MTEEDRSWQIEQFETFFLSKRLFPQLRWQRPRQMARRSLTKHWSQERTDRWSFANEFLCSASSKSSKGKKSIWLSRWLVDTRVQQKCVWSITRNPPSILLRVILTNNLTPHHQQQQHYHHHHHLQRHHHRVWYMWPSLFTLWHTSLHPRTGHQENIA